MPRLDPIIEEQIADEMQKKYERDVAAMENLTADQKRMRILGMKEYESRASPEEHAEYMTMLRAGRGNEE